MSFLLSVSIFINSSLHDEWQGTIMISSLRTFLNFQLLGGQFTGNGIEGKGTFTGNVLDCLEKQ